MSHSFDLDAYLSRIGVARPARTDLSGLAALHEAHCAAVPFENLDIQLGRPVRLDMESLQAKIVAGRRGGYCFEQNAVFQAALVALGFPTTALAARVRGGTATVRARTHMLLAVEVDGGPVLADVGFGADGPLVPVPFDGEEIEAGPFTHRLSRADDLRVLQMRRADGPWTDLYAFTMEPHLPVDFEMANHYTSTWPASPFVNSLTAQRTWRDGRAVLRNRQLVAGPYGHEETTEVRDPEHLLELLARHFGLEFPPGTRLRHPAF